MERWHRFGIFHFWNILPDNQFLRVEDQLKKKNKTLGTATKRKYCDFITRFLRVQQIKERNIALQSFLWRGWILAWRECKLDEFEWRTRPSCTAAGAK